MAMQPSGFIHRFCWQALALWKRLLSFGKRDWNLEDYPVILRTQETGDEPRPQRLQLQPHVAQIVNWWMSGAGETQADASAELERNFQNVKIARASAGKPLPRPGAQVPIQWASNERIAATGDLADDFVQRVLGFDWAVMSDDSSLGDFHSEETNLALIIKIKDVYGVDVSDIESARVCEILERILQSRSRVDPLRI